MSGIILVALKGMYTQAGQLPRYFREGKLEGLTWIVTFSAVVAVDVDIGYVRQKWKKTEIQFHKSFQFLDFFSACVVH